VIAPTARTPFRSETLRLSVPLAALAALLAFAVRETDPAGAAETGYLATLAAAVLLAASTLAPWPAVEAALGAVLATAAAWALPPGPCRGAAVMLLLIAALGVAAARALRSLTPRPPLPAFRPPFRGEGEEGIPLGVTIPLALGAQFLLRGGELLFEPVLSVRTLVALLVLPVAGAAAVSWLSRRHGRMLPLLAAGTAVALGPGWNVAATLALVSLAAGELLASPGTGRFARAMAAAPLLVGVAWEPGPGLAAAVCGVALARPRIGLGLAVPLAVALQLVFPDGSLSQLVWLPLLLPAVVLPERGRVESVVTAALLAATVPQVPDASALAAPLALAALSLRRRDWTAAPQRAWTAALLCGTALLASYPWLREAPLRDTLTLWTALPSSGNPLLTPDLPVVLDATHPARDKEIPDTVLQSLVIESNLSNGAGLAPSTPVALVTLRDNGGRTVTRTLRAGEDTGEWAARRPDVAQGAAHVAPAAWVSWIAGDFFGQRYRSLWVLDEPGRFTDLRIERAPGLPADTSLALHQVELRGRRSWPLQRDDPFFGTLLLLPAVLAAFWAIRRRAERLGGYPLGGIRGVGTAGELAALGVLVVLVLARPHLSLARAEEALAAGFFLVLAHRTVRQAWALRPLLGARLPERPSALFFLLPLTVYLAILPWSATHRQPDGDEPFYLLVTHSLAYDFDAELTNNYAAGDWRHFMDRPIEPQPGDPVGPDGELYSRHNELLPMALVPAYRLAGKWGALATMAAFTAALAWMTLRLGRRYVPDLPGETLAAWGLAAFAPPLLLYSYQVWVEVPAALLATIALDRILSLDRQRPWGWKDWLWIGLPVLLLPLVKIRFLLIAGPLLAMGWWYSGRPRRQVAILGVLLAAVAAAILLYNHFLYSNPLKIHTWEEVDPKRYSPVSYLLGGLGLFWDAAFGLFACAPLWFLVLPAAGLLAARKSRLLVHAAVLTLPYLVIVAPRKEWYGGWSPPFRYALIALPLLALALAPLLARRERPGARALLAGLGALTLVLALVWIAVPGWTYNFADGRTYALDGLSGRLGADLTRFFPSSVRPRPATWIWPPVSALLVSLLWWLPARRVEAVRAGWVGVALLLGTAALLPAAASRLPTRIVELEDPQVAKSGGHVHPDRWVIERTRFRGGWVLRVGERMSMPVTPGSQRARLTLQAEFIRNQPVPFTLDLTVGDRLLATWTPGRPRVWEEIEVGPFDWPRGVPLVLSARGLRPPGAVNGVILDKVMIDWL
jgi:hypothetical protein